MLSLERRNRRLADLDETSAGFALYPTLEPLPDDLRVTKVTYSAFVAASPALDDLLQSYGIDTLLIAGTLTNVCCETTARDGVVLDYNVIMVSDANATLADTQHAAALNTFMMFFGDVMMADEVERCLEGAG